jgi:hypothetical protein
VGPPEDTPERETLNGDRVFSKEPPLAADPSGTNARPPFIKFNNRPLREVVDDCLKAVTVANTPPTMFQQGNLLFRARSDGNDIFLEQIMIDSLRGFLERAATFGKIYGKDGELKTSYWPLPHDYVRDILALPAGRRTCFLRSAALPAVRSSQPTVNSCWSPDTMRKVDFPRLGGHQVNGVNFLSGGPPWPDSDEPTRASSRSRR